jgi:succinate-semialdehyde dehydrogenase/glutarate-semialdehyde dehydrogenase
MASKFRNAGQTCVCANRILLQRTVAPAFTAKRLAAADGLTANSQIGPLIDDKALQKVRQLHQDAVTAGATVLLGGEPHAAGALFYQPTVLADVTAEMVITRQEIFGPVAALQLFDTEQEAIELANSTEYGLAAYFYSRDVGRVFRVAQALQFGMVGINEGTIPNAAAPFGGVKQSGYGREEAHFGLDDYIFVKYLCLGEL